MICRFSLNHFLLGSVALSLISSSVYADSNPTQHSKEAAKIDNKTVKIKNSDPVAAYNPVEPTMRISGFTMITSTFSNQKINYGKGGPPYFSVGASNLKFKVAGLSSNGIEYGYIVVFNAFSHDGKKAPVDQNFIEIKREKDLGTFHFGNTSGVEDRFVVDMNSRMGGPGGILGYTGFYNLSAGAPDFTEMSIVTAKSTKVSWYSPRVVGLQFGISYTPNTSHAGREPKNTDSPVFSGVANDKSIYAEHDYAPYGMNNVSVGVNYKKTYGEWVCEASVIGILEKSRLPTKASGNYPVHQGKAYHVSAAILYKNLGIAGGFFDNTKSRIPQDNRILPSDKGGPGEGANNGNGGKGWNVGGLCVLGDNEFYINYNQSARKTNGTDKAQLRFVNVAYERAIFKGLKFLAEVGVINSTTNTKMLTARTDYDNKNSKKKSIPNNRGSYVIVGAKVAF